MANNQDTQFAGAALGAGSSGTSAFASPIGMDRLIRKEVSLGVIREIAPPKDHIGLSIAPMMEVGSDDVVFDYVKPNYQDTFAPARAEDAEAELAQKDDISSVSGRASIIDWALKDKYSASDVTRWREDNLIAEALQGAGVNLQLNGVGNSLADFNRRVARDDKRRRKALDNRIEQLIMSALWTNQIVYNDGKIRFTVPYGRPADQQAVAPASDPWNAGTTHDPIGDVMAFQDLIWTRRNVKCHRAITSQKVLNTIWKSDRFLALAGIVGGTPSSPIDPNYLVAGWGPQAAIDAVERVTGVRFEVYDSVYSTRPIGSQTVTHTRFSPETDILFLPDPADLGEVDDTEIGFGKTLTAPHPEGNWSSGFYEWEDEKRDPWIHVRGSGIKAFPVFPYLEYSLTARVLA